MPGSLAAIASASCMSRACGEHIACHRPTAVLIDCATRYRQAEVLRGEARWLRNLEHPHLLHCFDVFETRFHMVRQQLLIFGVVCRSCVQLPVPHAGLAIWVRRGELETGIWVMEVCGWSYVLPLEAPAPGPGRITSFKRVRARSCE